MLNKALKVLVARGDHRPLMEMMERPDGQNFFVLTRENLAVLAARLASLAKEGGDSFSEADRCQFDKASEAVARLALVINQGASILLPPMKRPWDLQNDCDEMLGRLRERLTPKEKMAIELDNCYRQDPVWLSLARRFQAMDEFDETLAADIRDFANNCEE